MTKLEVLEEFNHELAKLMNKYDAEFILDGSYGDIRGIDVQLPEGWISYNECGSVLALHDLQNPEFIVDEPNWGL